MCRSDELDCRKKLRNHKRIKGKVKFTLYFAFSLSTAGLGIVNFGISTNIPASEITMVTAKPTSLFIATALGISCKARTDNSPRNNSAHQAIFPSLLPTLNKCGKRRIATGRIDLSSTLRLAPLVNENVSKEICLE